MKTVKVALVIIAITAILVRGLCALLLTTAEPVIDNDSEAVS